MRVDTFRISAGGGLESLRRVDEPRQELKPGQLRVSVRAVTLNARDLLIARGGYPTSHVGPVVPCSDGAGEVIEVASGVSGWKVGDRVVGSFFAHWTDGPAIPAATKTTFGCDVDGWLRSEITLDVQSAVRIPEGMSYTAAACAPCAGVTAWAAMFDYAGLRAGNSVLVLGTGGVAVWGAQLAAAAGIRCVATSTQEKKLRALTDLAGVHGVLTNPGQSWAEAARRASGGQGVNLVLELLGRETIHDSIRAAAFGGKIAVIGGYTGWEYPDISVADLLVQRLSLTGIYVGSANMLHDLVVFCASKQIRPHVCAEYPFHAAPQAFAALAAKSHMGKIAIVFE